MKRRSWANLMFGRRKRKAKPFRENEFFIPEELTFAAPESPEFDRLLAEMIESLSRPLEPECPLCHEERKQYACIFPPVPCSHSKDDTLIV